MLDSMAFCLKSHERMKSFNHMCVCVVFSLCWLRLAQQWQNNPVGETEDATHSWGGERRLRREMLIRVQTRDGIAVAREDEPCRGIAPNSRWHQCGKLIWIEWDIKFDSDINTDVSICWRDNQINGDCNRFTVVNIPFCMQIHHLIKHKTESSIFITKFFLTFLQRELFLIAKYIFF